MRAARYAAVRSAAGTRLSPADRPSRYASDMADAARFNAGKPILFGALFDHAFYGVG